MLNTTAQNTATQNTLPQWEMMLTVQGWEECSREDIAMYISDDYKDLKGFRPFCSREEWTRMTDQELVDMHDDIQLQLKEKAERGHR